jgi:hypothetical protein
MKIINYLPVALLLVVFMSCRKDPDVKTKPVEFKTTTYETLGSYDATGKPNYLIAPDVISAALSTFIDSSLQDEVDLTKSHPELFSTSAIADVPITQTSDVFITYVKQDGATTNSFAFYTYPTTQPPKTTKDIKEIIYVFPNSGKETPLQKGDKVKIGTFEPGTSIGFVLLQESWDTTTNSLNNKVVHFCSNDVLNPEVDPALKKHAVLISYPPEHKVLIGFEDTNRTYPSCDNDFNDLLVYCTVTPH